MKSITTHLSHVELDWIPLAMFFFTVLLYIIVLFFRPEIFMQSLNVWTKFFMFFLPFTVAVIGVLGIVEAYLPHKIIANFLGDTHKVHGYLFAIFFGSLASSAQYAIFPTIKMLHRKGARSAILATFLFCWSGISIPLIPLEMQLFGPKFALIRIATIIFGALLFGRLTVLFNFHMDK